MSQTPDLPPSFRALTHPLVADRLSRLRGRDLPTAGFRALVRALSVPLALEALRDVDLREETIQTPLTPMQGQVLADPPPCLVNILRAGSGLVEGMLEVIPEAAVAHLGMYRDEQTLKPVPYYNSMPPRLSERLVVVCDPMLATGGSAVAAITQLKEAGARRLRFACLLAAPEGARRLGEAHPDVEILAAGLDSHLDHRGFIVPGLGDAGDRQFGTA